MALIEMDFLGKVDTYVETLLWTNPSPGSNFGTQIITLSDSISNYDYIKVQFLGSTTISTLSSVVTPVQDFILQQRSTNNTLRSITPGLQMSDGLFIRAFDYVSDTSINITDALRLNGSANNNSRTIPYKIYGIKKARNDDIHVKLMEETVVAGANTIETGVEIKKLSYIWQKQDGSNDKVHFGEWSDLRPNETWSAYNTSSSGVAKRSIPNSDSTFINSVGGTSFVFKTDSNGINILGDTVQFFIYY